MKERPDCEYCGWGKQLRIQHAYGERREIGVENPINEEIEMRVDSADDWETGFIGIDYNGDGFYIDINYCPMCGRCLNTTHSTHKAPPSDSSHKPIDGVTCTPENAAQPVFSIGDKIRFKSTGTIENVHTISHGGRFINGVNVEDVEAL